MQVITKDFIKSKRVLLRADIDVPLEKGNVIEDFRLKALLPTLRMCLENASRVIMIGHIGRPQGTVVEELKVSPIVDWLKSQGYEGVLGSGKLKVLENLRFDPREENMDEVFAQELASKGDAFVNEAFAAYRPAVSTTILPIRLPHAAGLRFAEEVRILREVREKPKKPFVAIMGGAKVEDKLPVIKVLAQKADAVLVGGKIAQVLIKHEGDPSVATLPQDDHAIGGSNVMVGKLNEEGTDIALETTGSWEKLIMGAKMIIWNGPMGKFEDPKNDQTASVARMILASNAEIVIGGGDTVAALNQAGLLEEAQQKGFVSVGGGAMLKLLVDGTLPTIKALS